MLSILFWRAISTGVEMDASIERGYMLSAFHPIVLCVFFFAVIVLSICIPVPILTAISLCFVVIAYVLLHASTPAKMLAAMLVLACVVTFLSPVFNPLGETVLFTYLGERPYTLEALAYGASIATMFAAMIVWFAVMTEVIDVSKIIYLIGTAFPKVGLIVVFSLSLISRFAARLKDLAQIGAKHGTSKIEQAGSRVENLIHWSFDEGIDRADSMKSRSFGMGKRTSYKRYSFTFKDAVALALVIGLVSAVVICAISGSLSTEYFPHVVYPVASVYLYGAMISFALLVALPVAGMVWGWLRWRICVSRI